MKVGFISTFLPQRCGIATYTNFLTTALRNTAPELSIRIIAESEAEAKSQDNFEVNPCWSRKRSLASEIKPSLEGLDIVHIQHEYAIYGPLTNVIELLDDVPPNIKKVITLHCIRPAHFARKDAKEEEIVLSLANGADRVIVHQKSQYLALKRMAIPEKKIELIPHGTEITRRDQRGARRRLNLPESAKIMLMFGFIEHNKNTHLVVESLKKIAVKVPDVHLFIAGGLAPNPQPEDQEYLNTIRKKIDELGPLKSRVNFAGYFFPHQDIPDLLASADVVLFPYCSEDRSASGALHLALGAGKPTVAYRIPKFEELSEICDELLVLPHNKKGLKRTIIRVLTDEKFREFATSQTKKYAEKTSWENTAQAHLQLYNNIL